MAKNFNKTLQDSNPAKSPALQFISEAQQQPPVAELNITDATYNPTAEELEALVEYDKKPTKAPGEKNKGGRPKSKAEIKSQRVQLVLKQSTLEEANNRAETLGLSRNEYITKLIELDAHKNLIK